VCLFVNQGMAGEAQLPAAGYLCLVPRHG
jgi:hypothetical protein